MVFGADSAEMFGKQQGLQVILVREETKPEHIHSFFASEGIRSPASHAAAGGLRYACRPYDARWPEY